MSERGYTVQNADGIAVELNSAQARYGIEELRSHQQLGLAIIAAVPAGLACALVWAFITVRVEWQIGWMAVGVAFLIGLTIRLVGRGLDPVFGVVGAVVSVVSCALGNLLAGCSFVAAHEGVATLDVIMSLNGPFVAALMAAMFNPMDVLFYGIAAYEGYRLSIHTPSAEHWAAAHRPDSGPAFRIARLLLVPSPA